MSFRILDPRQPSAAFSGRCAFAVMAKAPVPGKVKTRLTPPLTATEAAGLNACFLQDTVTNLIAAGSNAAADWVISYTPTGAEAAFSGILPAGARLLPQRGQGFGERLLAAAEDLFACGFSAVCLIDSDSPTVPTAEFAQAAGLLLAAGERAVLGCSTDGGYYLIGLQRAEARLFERIDWSTARVAAQTLERAGEINLPVSLLREWYDVDDAQSLEQLFTEFAQPETAAGYRAPHTRAYVAKLQAGLAEKRLVEAKA